MLAMLLMDTPGLVGLVHVLSRLLLVALALSTLLLVLTVKIFLLFALLEDLTPMIMGLIGSFIIPSVYLILAKS
ncbi:hypothetical protein REPUB_Repub05bG0200600 [Reevesia pubescens]